MQTGGGGDPKEPGILRARRGLSRTAFAKLAERVSVGPCLPSRLLHAALPPRGAPWVRAPPGRGRSPQSQWGAAGRGAGAGNRCNHVAASPPRDIAKNALLRWRVFVYWTLLGLFNALVFFFGAYFVFETTTVSSSGQVSGEAGQRAWARLQRGESWKPARRGPARSQRSPWGRGPGSVRPLEGRLCQL